MAMLLSQLLSFALVTCIAADGCFERFGSDEAKCKAAHGDCEWLGSEGEGKCVMPRRSRNHSEPTDGCFERFGTNKVNCTATNGLCLWIEHEGQGKCLKPGHSRDHGKRADGCFERFGTNKANCTATNGLCLWVEHDGNGKCVMTRHSRDDVKHTDSCFERFGTNEANCTATSGHCIWVEKYGEGKCTHKEGADRMDKPRGAERAGKGGGHKSGEKRAGTVRKEGGHESREEGANRTHKPHGAQRVGKGGGRKDLHKIVGVLSIFISSSLASPEVLENLKQQGSMLERALAHSHVYQEVTVLGLGVARRLRAAINTQAHVRFEAEATESLQSIDEAISSQEQLKEALQESFAKAGFDFQVQSATVAITSTEPAHTRSGDKRHAPPFLIGAAAIAAGLILCSGGTLLYMCLRKSSRSATKATAAKNELCVAPVIGVPCTDNDKCDTDIDLVSISTGTPSTNDNLSEGCP